MTTNQSATKLLLDPASAGELVGYSARQMRTFAARGIFPFVRLPGSRGIRFRAEKLAEVAAKHEMLSGQRGVALCGKR